MTIYVAAKGAVKVAIGSPGGHKVARIIRAGGIIPTEGVDQELLESLLDRGLITAVDEPETEQESYKDRLVPELKALIAERNVDRTDETKIVPVSEKKPDLIAALEHDDEKSAPPADAE